MTTEPKLEQGQTEVVVLDLRELPPPEPLQRALEAVAALPIGGRVTVLTRFRPAHLIDQLQARRCGFTAASIGAAGWQTMIWRQA
jgi:uncharacterized protein (DUF2249 family)